MAKSNNTQKIIDVRTNLDNIENEMSSYRAKLKKFNVNSTYKGKPFSEAPKEWKVSLDKIRQEISNTRLKQNDFDILGKLTQLEQEVVSISTYTDNRFNQLEDSVKKVEQRVGEDERAFKDALGFVENLQRELKAASTRLDYLEKNSVSKEEYEAVKKEAEEYQIKLHYAQQDADKAKDHLNRSNRKLAALTGQPLPPKISEEFKNVEQWEVNTSDFIYEALKQKAAKEVLSKKEFREMARQAGYLAVRTKALARYESIIKDYVEKIHKASEDIKFQERMLKKLKNTVVNEDGLYHVDLGDGVVADMPKDMFEDLQKSFSKAALKTAKAREKRLLKDLKPFVNQRLKISLDTILDTRNTPDNLKEFGLSEFAELFEGANYLFKGYDKNGIKLITDPLISNLYANTLEVMEQATNSSLSGVLTPENLLKNILDKEKYQFTRQYKYKRGYKFGEIKEVKRPVNQYRGYGDLTYTYRTDPEARAIRGMEGTVNKLFDTALYYLLGNFPTHRERLKKIVFRLYYANVRRLELRGSLIKKEKDGQVIYDTNVMLGLIIGTLKQALESSYLPPDIQQALSLRTKDARAALVLNGKGDDAINWVLEQFTKGVAVNRRFTYYGSYSDGTDVFFDSNNKFYFVKAPKQLRDGTWNATSILSQRLLPTITEPGSNVQIGGKELQEEFSAFYLLHRGLFVNKDTPDVVERQINLLDSEEFTLTSKMMELLDSNRSMILESANPNDSIVLRELFEGNNNVYGSGEYALSKRMKSAEFQNALAIKKALDNAEDEESNKGSSGGGGSGSGSGGGRRTFGGVCCCCQQRKEFIIPLLQTIARTTAEILKAVNVSNAMFNAFLRKKGITVSTIDNNAGVTQTTQQTSITNTNVTSKSQKSESDSLGSASKAAKNSASKQVVDNKTKKSSYQSVQDAKDKKRQEQKSFIALLIPELKKLLPRKAIWDAIKLLLFKFGANHPKLAAAALLAGPAVGLGALRLAGRTLLGLPGWASGGAQTVAKAGTFSGPVQNIKTWLAATRANTFSGNGIFSNVRNQITKQVGVEAQKDVIASRMRDNFKLQRTRELGKLRASSRTMRGLNSTADWWQKRMWFWSNPNHPEYYYNIPRTQPLYEWEKANTAIWGPNTGKAMDTLRNEAVAKAANYRSYHEGVVKHTTRLNLKGINQQEALFIESHPELYSKWGRFGRQTWGYTRAAGRGIRDGVVGNAKFNWAKYSKGGTVGTLKTIGNAAKGAGGIGALLEVLTDIPDIIAAATSGKKGALMQQLSKTLGGVIGAIVGAFFGPIGLILGPLLGRSIGEGFGKHSQGISESLGRLGNAFSELIRVCEPLINLFKVSFSWIGEVLAGAFMGVVDAITILVNAIAKAAHWIRYATDEEYRKEYDKKERQEKYIKDLQTNGTPQYTRMQQKAEDLLRKEYKSLSYKEKTGNVATINAQKPGFKTWDPTKATQAQLDAIEKSKKEAKKREDEWVKERLEQKTAELVSKEVSRTRTVISANQAQAVLGSGVLATVAATAAGNTTGQCLKYVENAFEKTYGVDLGRQGHAYQAAAILDNYANQGLVERHSWAEYKTGAGEYGGLKNLPENAIVVWSQGTSKSGHISIANGNGQEISDHVQEQMTSHYGGGVPTVYIPKMKEKLTQQQVAELKASYLANASTGTSTAADTAVVEAKTTDDARKELLNYMNREYKRNANDTLEKMVWDPTDVTGSLGCWGIVQLNNTGQMVAR